MPYNREVKPTESGNELLREKETLISITLLYVSFLPIGIGVFSAWNTSLLVSPGNKIL